MLDLQKKIRWTFVQIASIVEVDSLATFDLPEKDFGELKDDERYQTMTKWLINSSPGNLTCQQGRAPPNAHVVALEWFATGDPLIIC